MSGSVTPPDMAPQTFRLALDVSGEQTQAQLRLLTALLALGGASWLAVADGRLWLRIAALASAALALRIVLGYRAAHRAIASADQQYLEITADRVIVADAGNTQSVAREHVRRVELDHDRLVVVLQCEGGRELAIEPRYGGLTLEELGRALHRALCPAGPGDAQR